MLTSFAATDRRVEANAAKESRIPREQLAAAAQVHRHVPQRYVAIKFEVRV